MHEQRLGGRADVPAPGRNSSSVARSDAPRLAVVVRESGDRVDRRIAHAADRARSAAGTCTRRAPRTPRPTPRAEHRRVAEERLTRLLEARARARRHPTQTLDTPTAAGRRSRACARGSALRSSTRCPAVRRTGTSRGASPRGVSKSEPGADRRAPCSSGVVGSAARRRRAADRGRSRGARRCPHNPRPRAGREILEEVLDQVLLGQPLEHLDLLDRHRAWFATARARSRAGAFPTRRAAPSSSPPATSDTATREARPPRASSGPSSVRPSVVRGVRRLAATTHAGAAPPHPDRADTDDRRVGAEQPAAAARRPRARELSSVSAPAIASASSVDRSSSRTRGSRLVVEPRILDRPGHERGARDEELDLGSVNSRGATVWSVITPIGSPPLPSTGIADERLELLLLELGNVLDARVVEERCRG